MLYFVSEKLVLMLIFSDCMREIKRNKYLDQLISGRHNGLIKIITGIRCCGKSYLLFNLFHEYLISEGVEESHIIEIALNDSLNEEYRKSHKLLRYIKGRMTDNSFYYILLDDFQMMDDVSMVLNSLLHVNNSDVYVTINNLKFLSTDVASQLREHCDEIHVYPLSFAEYISVYDGETQDAWRNFCIYGGLPSVLSLDSDEEKTTYLQNLYHTVYLRDMVERNKIQNVLGIDKLIKILASSIGLAINPNKLAYTYKNIEHSVLGPETIGFYLTYLQEASLIEKSLRLDILGNKYVGTFSKYYFTEMGLCNVLLGFHKLDEEHLIENVLCNELHMRGFLVDVGMLEVENDYGEKKARCKHYEVDFVASKDSKRYFVQSAVSLSDSKEMSQKLIPLSHLPDNFKKIIIVKDNIAPWHNEKGILLLGLFDFLLNPESMDL